MVHRYWRETLRVTHPCTVLAHASRGLSAIDELLVIVSMDVLLHVHSAYFK